jgi:hypothetical protein
VRPLPDTDVDGVLDTGDNCDAVANPGQEDAEPDGVGDACDNCTDVENPSQLDADADLCGNACDCDFDQDDVCGGTDFNAFRLCFLSPVPGTGPAEDPTCAESDMDGGLIVGGTDFNAFRDGFLGPPGPGASCP